MQGRLRDGIVKLKTLRLNKKNNLNKGSVNGS